MPVNIAVTVMFTNISHQKILTLYGETFPVRSGSYGQHGFIKKQIHFSSASIMKHFSTICLKKVDTDTCSTSQSLPMRLIHLREWHGQHALIANRSRLEISTQLRQPKYIPLKLNSPGH